MSGQQRIYKQRIRSTQTLAKVFRAMELIAASRIGKARTLAQQSGPYDLALTHAVQALSQHCNFDHPLTRPRTDTNRVAVLVVTSDRGMAGAYSATILRETEKLLNSLREEGKEPVLFVSGRRAQSYFRFRGRQPEKSWEGQSDNPSFEMIDDIAQTLLEYFCEEDPAKGVAQVHIVFTRFKTMVTQIPQVHKVLPLEVVSAEQIKVNDNADMSTSAHEPTPLYEFEPSADEVFRVVLPMYVKSRIKNALLQSAASELANRQRAMHTATDNAEELIRNYTRMANTVRQAEITQEITEIVSGADSLGQN